MYVVTFYSFKGGVGRTLALINVAYELADSGQQVLVVDFDLEAPGIRADRWRKLSTQDDVIDDIGTASEYPGIVEYVGQYMETMRVPGVGDFIVDATPEDCAGRIALMPSGSMDDSYGKRLNEIDWNSLYEDLHGYVMFEDTRAQWEQLGYDYVLLDSRTGFTDVGGICTRHLPDAVVTLFRPEGQTLAGMTRVVESIRSEEPTPRRALPIELHFVMTGIPDADDEDGILENRREVFAERLRIPRGRSIEIRHYQSMDLLKQPIYTQHRQRTRLAASFRQLARRIRESNIEDRKGVLTRLRGAKLRRSDRSDFLDRVRREDRYNQDAEVLCELAVAYRSMGWFQEVGELLDKAAELGPLSLRHQWHLADARHGIGDREGALAALMTFFQDELDGPPGTEKRAMFVSVWRGLALLDTLEVDRSAYVANSPIVRELSPLEQARVAGRLDLSRRECREAGSIFQDLLQSGHGSKEQRSQWAVNLAFARMAVGSFGKALDSFQSALVAPAPNGPVPLAFNLAMAKWASCGMPDKQAFGKVIEFLDEGEDHSWLTDSPNALQALAIAEWFAERQEQAGERLDLAEQAIRRRRSDVSCWSYTRVPRDTFLNHCAEIRRLFAGEGIKPEFMRLAEHRPSARPTCGEGRGCAAHGHPDVTSGL